MYVGKFHKRILRNKKKHLFFRFTITSEIFLINVCKFSEKNVSVFQKSSRTAALGTLSDNVIRTPNRRKYDQLSRLQFQRKITLVNVNLKVMVCTFNVINNKKVYQFCPIFLKNCIGECYFRH